MAQPRTRAASSSPARASGARTSNSAVPIVSVGGEEFFQQGQNNIGDTLNELPQLRSTFSQSNAGRFLGTTGLNLLDLRGLGTQRTLVLVNGRRHVAADILNNGVSPDVNTIPNDLIERVDIVTGGNSAIYGSDAIAGVVNFILRRDFDGFQVRGQTGISEWGGGANEYVAAMFGHNFADGRGNITLHGEYAHEDRVYASDVPFLQQVNGFLVIENDPASAACNHGSDGIPDRVFFRDIRGANININSQIAFTQRTGQPGGPQCGIGIGPGTRLTTASGCSAPTGNRWSRRRAPVSAPARSVRSSAATARPTAKVRTRPCSRGRTATISTCSPIMRSATPSSCSSRPSSSASTRSARMRARPSSRAARSTGSASVSASTIRS